MANTALGFAVLLTGVDSAHARSFRVSQIPNGSVNGCANCHVNPAGGGPRNAFGTTIETSFLSVPGPGGNVLWGPALAAIDSDNDSRSNGRELQDPTGSWTSGQPAPGIPALVLQPGLPNPLNVVPALPLPLAMCLGLGLAGAGVWLARAKRQA